MLKGFGTEEEYAGNMSAMNQNYERAVNESDVYVKSRHGVPRGFFACEAAGLDWLREGESDGGARVVDVLGVSGHALNCVELSRWRRIHRQRTSLELSLIHI